MVAELETIHGYEMLGIIGEGTFGTVFKAHNNSLKKSYAIKVYKEPFRTPYTAR